MISTLRNMTLARPVACFLILTFAFAWMIWLPVGWLAPGQLLLAALPGAWAPTLAAVLLTGLAEGKTGLRQFFARLFHWRVGIQWYVVALFGVAAIALAANGLRVLSGGSIPPITLPSDVPRDWWLVVLPLIFLVNVFVGGPLAEDIGWRGYVLPKLRSQMNALNAGLIIGVVWVIWHLPFFLFPQAASVVGNVPFIWFALLTVAWSVLFAWVYVNTESILMPVLFHAAINTTLGSLGVLGQETGDFTSLILNVILTWGVVFVIVATFGVELKRRAPRHRKAVVD